MDVSLLIRQRLSELGLDQKDLAAAAQVTESYISQLLSRKKAPPAPERTDIYERIGRLLDLPQEELGSLAKRQRIEQVKKKILEPPAPLFRECRDLILRKAEASQRGELRTIFEKDPFGELERLVTLKILEVSQELAREELRNEEWLRALAQLSGRSYEQMRVAILEFLDSDIFHISGEGCISFLEPMIEAWSIDLKDFSIEILLNARLSPSARRRFAFVELPDAEPAAPEPGFAEFLADESLSGSATAEELKFLGSLRISGRKPAALFYYRELQNLRDPLHFLA